MSWAGPSQPHIQPSTAISQYSVETCETRKPTLLCLSHLRWGFVYQRPQHLMSRFAQDYRLLFWEEPVPCEEAEPWLEEHPGNVTVLVPRLPHRFQGNTPMTVEAQRGLLDDYLARHEARDLLLWYYTPMSLAFSAHLPARLVVYDCMDELSAFRGAPPELLICERALLKRADVVFTGGYSIWEAKRRLHDNAHPMPSSVDIAHFAAARQPLQQPADQVQLPSPRLGFFGVIDERFDLDLIDQVAVMRPHWQIVLIGPVVKIDPAGLPRRDNLHYLGGKRYDELPAYLAGWDVALMPFALNEATRFISPTKTPEYLAGGCPVVSTSITDVVRHYGNSELVLIADGAAAFVEAIEEALLLSADRPALQAAADRILGDMSWDKTWSAMREKIQCAM
ncbi:glycosyltransferase family 1 protein [Pseudomonas sp.]|uniref:glycosyltransferase family 1 protein n=1 Tax=Pseudomonas sp. TaxID=306 RepID=UPI001A0C19E3|nr:glycosyltransferase family 1 protein [Pseudomonas sp.]MBF0676790.1 glycosyltransferase family 1 protein [Pseudomonas sp.]